MNAFLWTALWAATASAWTADEPWRTVETEHYRIHYPLDTEAWALDLASRIDPMRERVAEVVGWAPDHLTDIVVLDPWSAANGFALPFAGAPRIGVFPTAAPASSGIGNYRLWQEDLLVHEDAHVLHLARPSRNPMERFLYDRSLGIPAIAVKSPAWVVEGYATLVEGVLTGAGRPNSDGRATFLRMLAARGQLPSYGELNGSERWRGRSMRYLVGSAYLEWLTERYGAERLPELWARMTAVQKRTFDEAFEGTFGDSARELYGRFCAELTAGALAVEPAADAAQPFLDLSGEVEPPAVSPDGTRIALVTKEDDLFELRVQQVEADAEAITERARTIAERLEADPEDVAPVDPKVAPHEVVATLRSPLLRPRSPRWLDSSRILFVAWVSDSHGVQQPDLYEWNVETGRTRRVTRQANLREAEPCGDSAIAIRRQHGLSSLVRVDLQTGTITPLTRGRPTIVEAYPRTDASCSTVSWLRHDQTWTLMVAPLDALSGGDPSVAWQIPLPADGQLFSADLHPDGSSVTAAIGTAGTIDLWTRPVTPGGTWVRRTTQLGGAFDPEVTTDGQTFFLTTDPEGFDLLQLGPDTTAPAPGSSPTTPYARGVVRPPPVTDAPPLPTGPTPAPRPYGFGPHQLRIAVGAQVSRQTTASDLGLVAGDLVGRSELLVLAGSVTPTSEAWDSSISDTDTLGVRAVWTHRRFPVHSTVDAWWLGFDDAALGAGATGHHHRRWATGRVDGHLGVFGEQATRGSSAATNARLKAAQWMALGPLLSGATLDTEGTLGLSASDPTLGHATLGLFTGQSKWGVRASGTYAGGRHSPLRVGDLLPGLQPEVRTVGTLWMPGLVSALPTTLTGLRQARIELRTFDHVLGFSAERTWLDCAPGRCDAPDRATLFGTEARFASGAQPIATIPGVALHTGLSCNATDEEGTLDMAACARWESYAAWLSVRVRPGSPPAYPTAPWR